MVVYQTPQQNLVWMKWCAYRGIYAVLLPITDKAKHQNGQFFIIYRTKWMYETKTMTNS